ncbi:MAG: EFR1 family ferrodoxin [Lachnospiraceae bacterium]|jgi:ferredoxin|nr:EFR1 family ferrodoxin [Lachnospiraceae bacterium]
MLTLYFSGTGNTKYVAEQISEKLEGICHSIEDDIDVVELGKNYKRICVCYPIYGSRMPRIFKEFVIKHQELFHNKEIIIIITQLIASGDGARAFIDVFPKNYFQVIYAEHINMPNNVCNFFLLKVKNGEENNKMLARADKKINKTCTRIKDGVIIRRGFNIVSRALGLLQGIFENTMNNKGKSIKTHAACNGCGLCVRHCPMKNLHLDEKKITHDDNCSICYRCVNLCPQKAITTFFHTRPRKQYQGL